MYSSLTSYVKISPNKTSPRNHVIDTITIHCMAGNMSLESCGDLFYNKNRRASSNYGIDSKGKVACYVEEEDRSWCSSNAANDNRAITIEVANDGGEETGWHVSDAALNTLISLCADICLRYNIPELRWKADQRLIGQVDKQNMTVHRWFANKACPGDYLYNKHGYIAEEVNKKLIPTLSNIDMSDSAIYFYFKSKGMTDAGVSGLLGNLFAESGLRSNNLQNSYESVLGYTDKEYVEAVDSKKHDFVFDKAGFGLAQWTYWSRKQDLLRFAVEEHASIGSCKMQCKFLYKELSEKFKPVLKVLETTEDVREASNIVLTQFERPALQDITVQNKRYGYANTFYEKYAAKEIKKCPFKVRVSIDNLNIREGAGTDYKKIGRYTKKGVFTVIEVKEGKGSKAGWGKLKSGIGWISLDYCEMLGA